MADTPEIHPVHKPHGVGVQWLELILSVSAIITSMVSVYIAIQHGEVMEKLVAANSLPYVQAYSGNLGDDAVKPSYLDLHNYGVGPAKVESLQVDLQGHYFKTLAEIITVCCTAAEAPLLQQSYSIYNMPERFIPAREVSHVFAIRRTAENAAAWNKFDRLRDRLHVSGCFCSVFDDCYRFDSQTGRSTPAKVCRADRDHEFRPLF